jgi:diaminohydroxyphosphoribosylaminopyrimidine deaminase/5-amino-6-(5-phosphoribosylamino)uracil reductase
VLEGDCRDINRPFIKHITTGLPYVTYKCAMTLDGKIASITGESRWISCDESRKYVHRMRSHNDAVMVGVDTILADNPQLTVRHVKGRNPVRIIVDSSLRTPTTVEILSGELARETIIACTEADQDIHRRYQQNGATVLVCNASKGRVDLRDLMKKLGSLGIQSILLEGGSRLAGEALVNGLIDECVFFYAPKVIGSDGFSPFAITGITDMSRSLAFTNLSVRRMGTDIVVTARPEGSCSPV